MSDLPPPPDAPPPPLPRRRPVARPGVLYVPPIGRPPETLGGAYYSTGLSILLTFVTCGIWAVLLGVPHERGPHALQRRRARRRAVIALNFVCAVVLMFTIPNEIEKMYQRDGRQSPVTTLWGLWFLLPIIGNIIWYVRVQRALNDFWLSKGSRPA